MRLLMVPVLLAGVLSAADALYDGSRVHYESHGVGKDAVVFIHGWTCDRTFWRAQEPVYKKQRALLVDLPGHGQSDKPEVSYTPERFARAVEAVMSHAGVDRGVLVGHSMGGAVAITFLRLFPARTKAFVLVDAYIPTGPEDDAALARRKAQMEGYVRSSNRSPDRLHLTGAGCDGGPGGASGIRRAASHGVPESRVRRMAGRGALPDDGEPGPLQQRAGYVSRGH